MASIDMLNRLNIGAFQLRNRLEAVTREVTTGDKAPRLGDLGPDVVRVTTLRAEISRRDTYGKVIDQAMGRTSAMQAALSRLTSIARDFGSGVAPKLDPSDALSVTNYAQKAKAALVEVGNLLNTSFGGEYVFGGSDIANPPIADPESLPASGMATQIAAAVSTLAAGNAATVNASTLAIAASNAAGTTPFSAFLSASPGGLTEPRRSLPVDDGTSLPYGIAANRNAAAVSVGTDTTGSWARDLLRGLSSIAALTPAKAQAEPQAFQDFAGMLQTQLMNAATTIGFEAGQLGDTQKLLETTSTRHSEFSTVLQEQLAGLKEADMADSLSRLQATQTALEASYRAIGQISSLSLTRFL